MYLARQLRGRSFSVALDLFVSAQLHVQWIAVCYWHQKKELRPLENKA